MKIFFGVFILVFCFSCEKNHKSSLQENVLADYIELNAALEMTDLIACAGGKEGGLFNTTDAQPTTIFFYPIDGATEFRYFETENVADSLNFSAYRAKDLMDEPVFNGYLRKFNNSVFRGERMGIVTYKSEGKLHVCNPIRLKTNTKPTEVNSDLATVTDNGVTPSFTWSDGLIDENVIYFQVISDTKGNLVSGTYTLEKDFTFYNLDNVVLNITDPTMNPILELDQEYRFTMMAVSQDNWVNLFIEKTFFTN